MILFKFGIYNIKNIMRIKVVILNIPIYFLKTIHIAEEIVISLISQAYRVNTRKEYSKLQYSSP